MHLLKHFLLIAFSFVFSLSSIAQCPNSLSGYSYLGQYGNSKYFMSNNSVNWNTAKSNAASSGGYLASITSQGENDFIFGNLNSIVFIGYNDKQSEGNFKWDSGESVGFNKFADTNTSAKDYGKMNNWNGNWGVDNQYVSRKYIVEIPCSGGGGSGINITSCPNNISQIVPHGGNYSANVSWNIPTATTDCAQGGLTVTQILGPSPGVLFVTIATGQQVVYEITDACGNSEICTFIINLSPTAPDVNCPSDITVTATSSAGRVVNYEAPSVTTFCNAGNFQLNQGLASGSQFPIGTTDINISSFLSGPVGFCQVTVNCNFSVTVLPQGSGGNGITITSCPDDQSAIAPHGGNYSVPLTWNLPTATTDCAQGGLTITQILGNSPGSNFFPNSGGNSQTQVYEIKDACGNVENCIFFISVSPEQPIVTCPTDITVTATSSAGRVVNYSAPSVETYCNNSPWQVNQGLASGSLFPIGTTDINMSTFLSSNPAFCQITENCNFTVTVLPQGGGGGDCPNSIPGFTTIGEYGNSKYYLSNSNSKPEAAQATAASNGGYLAVITDNGENNFIKANINVMTYIGLNDVASEGNLKWVNGEAYSFNKVDPCNFCNQNSGSLDYVIMAPWDGKWSFSSKWNSRPYVMEIPCDGNTGGGKPDLTLSNITNLGNPLTVGAIENFNFNLNNIGTATAVNSYKIKMFISTDQFVNQNQDYLVGEITTANTVIGTDPNVPASITVPNIPNGNYYLLLYVDLDQEIGELVENNNILRKSITVGSSGGGGCTGSNPPSISGFTYKASVGNKLYYLSNSSDRPTNAEAKCVNAGGHLATVNSTVINNALKTHTNGLVYIGLHDENTEGSLQWRSGASLGNTNFDNCSICEPNSGSKDYVVIQGWNGKWSWSSLYNSRKYWLEIDCNNFNSNNNSTLIALSTNEGREILDFQKIVPNPANNHIFVQVKSKTAMAIDVEIYDARGMLLKTKPAELFDGINAVEVDIADLPGGFYLVKIPQMKGLYATKRFVKVRN